MTTLSIHQGAPGAAIRGKP